LSKYHKISQVASQLNLSVPTVWRYVRDGILPAFKMGGITWRITDEALQQFINGSEYSPEIRGSSVAEIEANAAKGN